MKALAITTHIHDIRDASDLTRGPSRRRRGRRPSQETVAPCRTASGPPEDPRAGPTLHQGRLALEDRARLLEPRDLRLAAPLPLLVGLWLRDAPVLDLRVVVEDAGELLAGGVLVGGVLGDGLVEALELLCLVLHVLLLQGPCHLVLLGDLLVLRHRVRLGRLLRC